MKHSEIYDKHADRRQKGQKPKKKKGSGEWDDRHHRVSFKNYVRQIRDKELEDEDDFDDEQ